jgi:hypothetical protein
MLPASSKCPPYFIQFQIKCRYIVPHCRDETYLLPPILFNESQPSFENPVFFYDTIPEFIVPVLEFDQNCPWPASVDFMQYIIRNAGQIGNLYMPKRRSIHDLRVFVQTGDEVCGKCNFKRRPRSKSDTAAESPCGLSCPHQVNLYSENIGLSHNMAIRHLVFFGR